MMDNSMDTDMFPGIRRTIEESASGKAQQGKITDIGNYEPA